MRAFFGVSLTVLFFSFIFSTNLRAESPSTTYKVLLKYFASSSDPKVKQLLEWSKKGMLNIETSLTIKGKVNNFSQNRYLNYLRGINETEDFIPVIFNPDYHIDKRIEDNLFSENLIETDFLTLKSLDSDEELTCIGLRKFMIPWNVVLVNWVETFLANVDMDEKVIKLSESDVIELKKEATVNLFSDFVINVDLSSEKITFKPQTIYFAHNSSEVNLDYLNQNIDPNAFVQTTRWLEHYLQLGCETHELIHLAGHADRSGGSSARAKKYNQEISLKRANSVKQMLREKVATNIESENIEWLDSLFVVEGMGVSESSSTLYTKNDMDRRVEIDIDPALHEKEYLVLSQPSFKHSRFNFTVEANEQYEQEKLEEEIEKTTNNQNSCTDNFKRKEDQRLCIALLVELEKQEFSGDPQQVIKSAIKFYHNSYLIYQFQKMNKSTCRLNEVVYYSNGIQFTFTPTSRKKKNRTQLPFANYRGFSAKRSFSGNKALKEVDQNSSEFDSNNYYESSDDSQLKYFDYPYKRSKKYLRIELKKGDYKDKHSKPVVSC